MVSGRRTRDARFAPPTCLPPPLHVLQAAGFSRSNPYYVVPQGKVAQLADMDDA